MAWEIDRLASLPHVFRINKPRRNIDYYAAQMRQLSSLYNNSENMLQNET